MATRTGSGGRWAGALDLGDQLLALLAQDVLVDCPGATILGDVKASQAVLTGCPRWAAFPRWEAGHSLIKSE
jgi:phosphomannomutase